MKVLGINDSHDSGVALIEDGKITFAVNEERLNKLKLCYGFPRLPIAETLKWAKIRPEDIDYIGIASKYLEFKPYPIPMADIFKMPHNRRNKVFMGVISKFFGPFFRTRLWIRVEKLIFFMLFKGRQSKIRKILKEEYGFKCPIKFIDHHLCHAASAYFTSGKDEILLVTSDGAGDALSGTISITRDNRIRNIKNIGSYNSIAKYYGYVTTLCGFTAGKHEGKITGLAAHGKPIYLNFFKKMIITKRGNFINLSKARHQTFLKEINEKFPDFKKEDMASSIQEHLEEEYIKFLTHWIKKTNQKNIVLAGGLFANVLLNQKIKEIPGVEFIYIHPNMGDGGLALGAALFLYNKNIDPLNQELKEVYLGPNYSDEEIEQSIKRNNLKYSKEKNIAKIIANLLLKGKVVARFDGRMEYGPRALGNRTILYKTNDKNVNDWLNKRLKRTEFMPFAPVTLAEDINLCYENPRCSEYSTRFMTMTLNCTDFMKRNCPGVVHLDGTARPQIISKDENPIYYNILKEYKKLSGLPCLINTSFNMHESPIVCTPQDAIDSFKEGYLDYLAIGNFLIKNNDPY